MVAKHLGAAVQKDVEDGATIEDAGYYMFVDSTEIGKNDDDVKNLTLLQVTGSDDEIKVTVKTDKPTSEKKVKDINDSTGAEESAWQDSADYDFGDDVPFQLKATLPENVLDYEKYILTFHDQEDSGLKFNSKSVVVYVNGTKITEGFTVVTEGLTDGCTFEVQFSDVTKLTGIKDKDTLGDEKNVITVEYTATLTEDAVVGVPGNKNKMQIEYSNDVNSNGEGTGKTPLDTVVVFTFDLDVNKVDGENNPLKGAGFTLSKWDGTKWNPVGDEINTGTTFSFNGLDDGYYKLEETTVPAGYNKADDVLFVVEATHDEKADGPQLKDLTIKKLTQNADGTVTASPEEVEGKIEVTMEPTDDAAMLNTDVVNNKGAELPETGGMGTTIFYVVGAILILGAGILLVTNKRMSK